MTRDTRNMLIGIALIAIIMAIGWYAFRAINIVGGHR